MLKQKNEVEDMTSYGQKKSGNDDNNENGDEYLGNKKTEKMGVATFFTAKRAAMKLK